jgi:hypothetical protein
MNEDHIRQSNHVTIGGKDLRAAPRRDPRHASSDGVHRQFADCDRAVAGACADQVITVALASVKTQPLNGVTIIGDAIFTQKPICQAIVDGGGDYFFTVKENQPALKADIAQVIRPFST